MANWSASVATTLFLSVCTSLLPGISTAQNQYVDLDNLSSEQLQYYLNAELDDAYVILDENRSYNINFMFNIIMEALSDNGDYSNDQDENDDGVIDDDNDEGEQVITSANLASEMAEAGTSLQEVVWQALKTADQYSNNTNSEIMNVQMAPDDTVTLPRSISIVIPRAIEKIKKPTVPRRQSPPSQY